MDCLISKSKRTKGKDKDYARKSAGDGCLSSNETQSKTGSTVDGGFLSDEKHNEDGKTADECLSSDEKQNKKESTADGCLLLDEKQNEEGSTDAGSCPSDESCPFDDFLEPPEPLEPPDLSLNRLEGHIDRGSVGRWRRFDRNYSKELKQTSVETIQLHQDQPQVWVPPPPPDPPNPQ